MSTVCVKLSDFILLHPFFEDGGGGWEEHFSEEGKEGVGKWEKEEEEEKEKEGWFSRMVEEKIGIAF